MSGTILIRQFRDEKGLTQGDLGERVGVTAATISRWEAGQREPRGDRLRRLAEVMGVPISRILDPVDAEAAQ